MNAQAPQRLPQLCIDKAGDQLFLLDSRGHIINANEAACLALGYRREELLDMRFADIDQLLSPLVWPAHWLELKQSQTVRFASEHRNKDGSLAQVEVRSRLIKLDGQDYICAIVHDTQEQAGLSDLEESNERFRILFEHAAVGMVRMAANGEFLQVNDPFCRLVGHSREEILAKSLGFRQLTFAEDLGKALKLHQKLLDGKIPAFSLVQRYIHKRGQVVWVNVSVSLLRDQTGKPLYFIGTIQDITDSKQTEEALRGCEERLRYLSDNLPDSFIFQYARDGLDPPRFLHASRGVEAVLGFSAEDLCRDAALFHKLIDPRQLPTLLEAEAASARDQSDWGMELRVCRTDGQWRRLRLNARPRRLPYGLVVWEGVVTDISATAQEEQPHSLTAAVFNHTHDGIIVTDLAGRIERVNPAFVALTGYAESEAVGRNTRMLKSNRHPPDFYAALWASLKTTGHWRGEIWNRHQSGEIRPQLMTISAITDGTGQPTRYVSVFSDISKLKESEAQLNFLAHHDPLTGLANRRMLEMHVEHALEAAARHRQPLALLMIDLDHFKDVNDTLGHPAGDELLKEVSLRFAKRLRQSDTLARLGGDEFAVLLERPTDLEAAGRVAQDLLSELENPVALSSGASLTIGASIGVSLFPEHGACCTDLMKRADAALYQAKSAGRGRFRYFDECAAA